MNVKTLESFSFAFYMYVSYKFHLQPLNDMNRLTIAYRIVMGLMATFMASGAIFDVISHPEAIKLITHLGYPTYFVPYIGLLKLLGVAVIVLPVFGGRLREWAFAGLTFDVVSALYSAIAVGDGPAEWAGPLIGIVLVVGSYVLYRRKEVQQPVRLLANVR